MPISSILSIVLMFFLTSITYADEWGTGVPTFKLDNKGSAPTKAISDSKSRHKTYEVAKVLEADQKVTSMVENRKSTEETIPSNNDQKLSSTSRQGVVNATRVNLRGGPSLKERILMTMMGKGRPVEVLGQEDDWFNVKVGNDEGWIHRTLIALDQENSATASFEDHGTPKSNVDDIKPVQLPPGDVDSPVLARVTPLQIAEGDRGKKPEKKSIPDASTVRSEDLIHVYKLAQENDPTFQSEKFKHEASPETLKQAYSEIWPTVTGDASYQRTRQKILETDIAVYGQDLARYPSKGYNLTLTQPILRYSSFMRIMQAKEEVKQADFAFEKAKQDLILRVVEAYIGSLEAYDNLEFTRAEEDALRLHFEEAQERYKSGLAPITDFHDAKARFAYIRAQRVKAEDLLDDALEALAEVTGQKINNLAKLKYKTIKKDFYQKEISRGSTTDKNDGGPQAAKSGLSSSSSTASEKTEGAKGSQHDAGESEMPLVPPDPDEITNWIDAALEQNLEVHVQRQAVLVAKREIERQRAGHWPTLSVVGRVNRDDEGGSLFGGESDVNTREAILQLNVPIFQGFSVLSKTREAQKLYAAAKENLEKEIRAAKRGTRAAFHGVKSAIKNTEALRQSVVSHRIALEAKREGFKSGVYHILAVLDAERDFHQAEQEFAKAQYEYILNSIRLKKAVGILNEEDLLGVNQWLE